LSLLDWFGRKKEASRRTLTEELTDFYREHRSLVFAYFHRVTGSREESEELTQETFYQAVKSLHRFEGKSSLKTWLLQIARNVYRNRVRTWVRDRKHRAEFEVLEGIADDSKSPEHLLHQSETREELSRLLLRLPEEYREVLVLKELKELSHADIAHILGKTPQTTKVLLYRAKQKLRDLYEREVLRHEEPL